MDGLTRQIADFATRLSYRQLPPEIIAAARRFIVDTLACAITARDCESVWIGLRLAEGRGVVVYLRQEGRGIGLLNKIRAYALQDAGADTVDANRLLGFPDDARDYRFAAHILDALGIRSVRLMTNNPAKTSALRSMGIEVTERVALHAGANALNHRYLATKVRRMGHAQD